MMKYIKNEFSYQNYDLKDFIIITNQWDEKQY